MRKRSQNHIFDNISLHRCTQVQYGNKTKTSLTAGETMATLLISNFEVQRSQDILRFSALPFLSILTSCKKNKNSNKIKLIDKKVIFNISNSLTSVVADSDGHLNILLLFEY